MMDSLLHFWNTTKVLISGKQGVDNIKILVPSRELAEELRVNYIPKIIEFVKKEDMETANSLQHLLQFLFLYDEITHNIKKKSEDDPKLIEMLPILVNISEKLLEENAGKELTKYQKHALSFKRWLRCSKDIHDRKTMCEECKNNDKKKVPYVFGTDDDSPLVWKINIAVMKIRD